MKILILLENLVLKPEAGYAVVESSIQKIRKWLDAGAEVEYLTAINKFLELKKIDDRFDDDLDLPDVKVHKKQENEKFKEVVALVSPHIFIDLAGSLDGIKSISDQLQGERKVVALVLNNINEMTKLPDYPEELKDCKKEKIVEEVE